MGYQVKWVEENLGVSRKALRNFERMGLMKPNEDRKYRDYSDEDIERIWTIRLLQGIGYSLKEIVNMSENEEFDFDKSLSKKIEELEEKKAEIEKSLGYAKYIKFSGRIPYGPKELGSITAEEFHHKALNEWNVNNDEEIKKHQEIADILLNSPEEDLEDTELGKLIEVLTEFSEILSNPDNLMA